MSDNSRNNNSYSSIKSPKRRFWSMQSSDRADGIKRGLNHINDLRKNMGSTLQGMFSGKSNSSVYSKSVRELDSYGYEKYNLDDNGGEIFISKVPEKAFFNDGKPLMIRATEGNFVGGSVETTSANIDIGEVQTMFENPRSLFINVPQGSTIETEYRATVGEVTADGMVKPKPMNSAFLGKMKSFNSFERPATHIVLEDKVPEVEPEPVVEEASKKEISKFFQIDDDVEMPVEEFVRHSFLDRVFGLRGRKPVEEFFANDPVEESVVEEAFENKDDYDWISFDDEESQEEVFVEVPLEEPIEQDAQVLAEHVVSEISAEEIDVKEPVVVMTLRNIPVEPLKPIAGLEIESSEPSAGSAVTEDISASNMIAQTTETSAEVELTSTTLRFNGLEEDGEAYPPLSDPVVKRPRTVRFRFSNGILQNVESNDNKSEPMGELRDPLD